LRLKTLPAWLLLASAILACNISGRLSTPIPPVLPTEPAAPAATLPAPPTVAATETPSLLPAALYYLSKDETGRLQLFRLAPDGVTSAKLTSEPVDVGAYDVSPTDGRIAYIVNNQLVLMNGDGSNRTVLVDGGQPSDAGYTDKTIGSPRFSPDGRLLAYGMNGLNFYDLSSGETNRPLTDKFRDAGGLTIVDEVYTPNEFSPDGSRLLVSVGYYEAGTLGVYDMASGVFNKLERPGGGILCCSSKWTSDSSAVYVASPVIGMVDPGMWRFEAADGAGSTLLPPQNTDSTYNFADAPLVAPDGQLYFLFANLPAIPASHTPLMLVRSAPDGVTGRTVIYPDTFTSINEALWAPDASKIILVESGDSANWVGGAAALYSIGGGAPVKLLPDAGNLRWGP
jgi:dipeptidyl aminopeptidase/acylaminoacyl peptidase